MKTLALTVVALALAASAQAETPAASPSLAPASADRKPARPVLVLPKPGVDWQAVSQKTAVEHRGADGVTAAAGYLCGIDKFADRASERLAGPASSYGRQGTFLGASVGVSF